MSSTTFQIFFLTLKYALISFGGMISVLPQMQDDFIARGWITASEISTTYAIVAVGLPRLPAWPL